MFGSLIESNQNGINAKGMKINIAVRYTRPEITPKLSGLILNQIQEFNLAASTYTFSLDVLLRSIPNMPASRKSESVEGINSSVA